MRYFSLFGHCYLVWGAKKAAIYDVFQKRVFWVEQPECLALLKGSQRMESFEEIAAAGFDEVALRQAAEFYQKVELGALYDKPAVSTKFRPFVHNYLEVEYGYYRPLGVVTLEVSSECPKNCAFCHPGSRLASSECACGVYSSDKRVSYDIDQTLQRLSFARVGLLELMGGDPYTNREDLERIVSGAAALSIPVKIKTTGALIDYDDISFLKSQNAAISLTLVNAGRDADEIGRLTRILGFAMDQDYHNLDVNLLFDEQNMDVIRETLKWFEKHHITVGGMSGYYPAAADYEDTTRQFGWFTPKSHTHYAIDCKTLPRSIRGHSCWQDRICIMINGDVKLCIADTRVCGNIHKKNILDIIRDDRQPDTERKNTDCEPCSHCEFSLGCFSCSVATDKVIMPSKAWNCVYDPYTGRFSSQVSEQTPVAKTIL